MPAVALADLTVRRAVSSDAMGLAAVQVESWNDTYRGLMPDSFLDTFTLEHRTRVFERFLDPRAAHPVPRIWVACRPEVVGFASVGASRGEIPTEANTERAAENMGELYAIYVAPSELGTGVGRALLATALTDLRSLGHEEVILWVHAQNRRARRFYEAAGLHTDGATKDEMLDSAAIPHVRYRGPTANC